MIKLNLDVLLIMNKSTKKNQKSKIYNKWTSVIKCNNEFNCRGNGIKVRAKEERLQCITGIKQRKVCKKWKENTA